MVFDLIDNPSSDRLMRHVKRLKIITPDKQLFADGFMGSISADFLSTLLSLIVLKNPSLADVEEAILSLFISIIFSEPRAQSLVKVLSLRAPSNGFTFLQDTCQDKGCFVPLPEIYLRPDMILEDFSKSLPVAVCGKVIDGQIGFRCQTCTTDQSSVMCAECFDPDIHRGHDFKCFISKGLCDCGCAQTMSPSGFCLKHRGNHVLDDPTSVLLEAENTRLASGTSCPNSSGKSVDLQSVASISLLILTSIFQALVYIPMKMRNQDPAAQDRVATALGKTISVLVGVFERLFKTSKVDAFRHILTRATISTISSDLTLDSLMKAPSQELLAQTGYRDYDDFVGSLIRARFNSATGNNAPPVQQLLTGHTFLDVVLVLNFYAKVHNNTIENSFKWQTLPVSQIDRLLTYYVDDHVFETLYRNYATCIYHWRHHITVISCMGPNVLFPGVETLDMGWTDNFMNTSLLYVEDNDPRQFEGPFREIYHNFSPTSSDVWARAPVQMYTCFMLPHTLAYSVVSQLLAIAIFGLRRVARRNYVPDVVAEDFLKRIGGFLSTDSCPLTDSRELLLIDSQMTSLLSTLHDSASHGPFIHAVMCDLQSDTDMRSYDDLIGYLYSHSSPMCYASKTSTFIRDILRNPRTNVLFAHLMANVSSLFIYQIFAGEHLREDDKFNTSRIFHIQQYDGFLGVLIFGFWFCLVIGEHKQGADPLRKVCDKFSEAELARKFDKTASEISRDDALIIQNITPVILFIDVVAQSRVAQNRRQDNEVCSILVWPIYTPLHYALAAFLNAAETRFRHGISPLNAVAALRQSIEELYKCQDPDSAVAVLLMSCSIISQQLIQRIVLQFLFKARLMVRTGLLAIHLKARYDSSDKLKLHCYSLWDLFLLQTLVSALVACGDNTTIIGYFAEQVTVASLNLQGRVSGDDPLHSDDETVRSTAQSIQCLEVSTLHTLTSLYLFDAAMDLVDNVWVQLLVPCLISSEPKQRISHILKGYSSLAFWFVPHLIETLNSICTLVTANGQVKDSPAAINLNASPLDIYDPSSMHEYYQLSDNGWARSSIFSPIVSTDDYVTVWEKYCLDDRSRLYSHDGLPSSKKNEVKLPSFVYRSPTHPALREAICLNEAYISRAVTLVFDVIISGLARKSLSMLLTSTDALSILIAFEHILEVTVPLLALEARGSNPVASLQYESLPSVATLRTIWSAYHSLLAQFKLEAEGGFQICVFTKTVLLFIQERLVNHIGEHVTLNGLAASAQSVFCTDLFPYFVLLDQHSICNGADGRKLNEVSGQQRFRSALKKRLRTALASDDNDSSKKAPTLLRLTVNQAASHPSSALKWSAMLHEGHASTSTLSTHSESIISRSSSREEAGKYASTVLDLVMNYSAECHVCQSADDPQVCISQNGQVLPNSLINAFAAGIVATKMHHHPWIGGANMLFNDEMSYMKLDVLSSVPLDTTPIETRRRLLSNYMISLKQSYNAFMGLTVDTTTVLNVFDSLPLLDNYASAVYDILHCPYFVNIKTCRHIAHTKCIATSKMHSCCGLCRRLNNMSLPIVSHCRTISLANSWNTFIAMGLLPVCNKSGADMTHPKNLVLHQEALQEDMSMISANFVRIWSYLVFHGHHLTLDHEVRITVKFVLRSLDVSGSEAPAQQTARTESYDTRDPSDPPSNTRNTPSSRRQFFELLSNIIDLDTPLHDEKSISILQNFQTYDYLSPYLMVHGLQQKASKLDSYRFMCAAVSLFLDVAFFNIYSSFCSVSHCIRQGALLSDSAVSTLQSAVDASASLITLAHMGMRIISGYYSPYIAGFSPFYTPIKGYDPSTANKGEGRIILDAMRKALERTAETQHNQHRRYVGILLQLFFRYVALFGPSSEAMSYLFQVNSLLKETFCNMYILLLAIHTSCTMGAMSVIDYRKVYTTDIYNLYSQSKDIIEAEGNICPSFGYLKQLETVSRRTLSFQAFSSILSNHKAPISKTGSSFLSDFVQSYSPLLTAGTELRHMCLNSELVNTCFSILELPLTNTEFLSHYVTANDKCQSCGALCSMTKKGLSNIRFVCLMCHLAFCQQCSPHHANPDYSPHELGSLGQYIRHINSLPVTTPSITTQNTNQLKHSIITAMTLHAAACCIPCAVFLPSLNLVLCINGSGLLYIKAGPYLDSFGEDDPSLESGNPTFLNKDLTDTLQRMLFLNSMDNLPVDTPGYISYLNYQANIGE